jgi:hypothetical protein
LGWVFICPKSVPAIPEPPKLACCTRSLGGDLAHDVVARYGTLNAPANFLIEVLLVIYEFIKDSEQRIRKRKEDVSKLWPYLMSTILKGWRLNKFENIPIKHIHFSIA